MFKPKTNRIEAIRKLHPEPIAFLQSIFGTKNLTYVDWGNVKNWPNRLNWHVCHKRLFQFVQSFDGPTTLKFYFGTDPSIQGSEDLIAEVRRLGYDVHTKPVKHIKKSMDVSSISAESPDIIKHLIFPRLLDTFSVDLVRTVNDHLRTLNKSGIFYFEDLKCNFDVEIGRDLLADWILNQDADTFSIWSGDSDFADPIESLLNAGKRVAVFGVSGMIARELNELRSKGLIIVDVKKIREYICWPRELPPDLRNA